MNRFYVQTRIIQKSGTKKLRIFLTVHTLHQARIQKCGLGGGGSSAEDFGIFSFEMLHFDAFLGTF